jgi:hypothetical protein
VQACAGHQDVKTTQPDVHHQTKAQDADLGGAYLDAALARDVSAPGWIRTNDLRIRSPLLYPAELQGLGGAA